MGITMNCSSGTSRLRALLPFSPSSSSSSICNGFFGHPFLTNPNFIKTKPYFSLYHSLNNTKNNDISASMAYEKELAAAKKAASHAARLCQKVQKALLHSDVQSKSDKTPVTVAYCVSSSISGKKENNEKSTLAKNLALVLEESISSNVDSIRPPKTRMELKRSLELRVKKRVKELYSNGKFRDLMVKVIANPDTLRDAYDCIRVDSNVELASSRAGGTDNNFICFESIAEELSQGNFDVNANSFSISTKGGARRKEVIVLPNVKLKVVQEAIRIVLEVVYRPHFSKLSHGCRSGRGHSTALKYICKEISHPDWWFTLLINNKKLDSCIFAKLISTMEEKIEDPSLYAILQSMFGAQVLNLEFGGFSKGHGLPQEGVLSPILMNIYLDLFDHEMFRLSMKYEALDSGCRVDEDGCSGSKLRSWFRRQLNGHAKCKIEENSGKRVHACRFMDEIFFAVSGSKDAAFGFKSELQNFFQNSLHLNVDDQTEILPCNGSQGIRFLGILIRRSVKEGPALRAVHKLKDKINLFALQKQEIWDAAMVRIGKKWVAHGLKKVKESEIKHLSCSSSVLCQISRFRKDGMKTDHWYKQLLKIWMQDVNAKVAVSEDMILSKYVAEQAIPQELRDSFYEFQARAKEYISSETASTLALFPDSSSSTESVSITEIIAPVNVITKRLLRYGLINSEGYPRACPLLILQDKSQIIDWFSGIGRRWLRWYSECDNYIEIKCIISDQVRKSCIRTLATKYRLHEAEIEKRFDSELSQIPSTQDIDHKMINETSDSKVSDSYEALMYGFSDSGLPLLSVARLVSQSRPCNCFVVGCLSAAPMVYTLHVMERQKFPGWQTGFSSCIHSSLNRRRVGLCNQHLKDLYLGHISLQSIDFGAWR